MAATAAFGASAVAAPSASGISHRNVHVCATPAQAGYAACMSVRHDTLRNGNPVTNAAVPAGYGPADIQAAYKLPTTASNPPSGPLVAIVDAYDLGTAESDLATYRSAFGLPPCTKANGCFTKVGQTGTSTLPRRDAGWGQEIALDLDMVSAACPNCRILLVEAKSASFSNLATGVATAQRLGAKAISNSYGGSDYTNMSQYENAA